MTPHDPPPLQEPAAPEGPALPAAFEARVRRLLGDEAEALLAALAGPPTQGLRVNPARTDLARLAALTGWRLTPLPWAPDAARLDAGADRPGLHPLHEAGAYYLQEPSATAPAAALALRPGERAIDLAAAPGGKSTQLAAALRGEGLLVANDVHPQRVRALARNLERWGARRTAVANEAPARLAERWPEAFDAVLLDAPCSGEGMFRKSEEARRDWSEATVTACAARQDELLDAAAALLAPGGRLVYSTCTFAPEENERAVAALLARRPDLRPDPLDLPGLSPGRPEWVADLAPEAVAALAAATARAWPHRQPGEGHFLARLVRDGSVGSAGRGAAARGSDPRGRAARPAAGGRAGTGRAVGERGGRRRGRGRRPGEGGGDAPAPREAAAAWEAFAAAVLAPGALPEARGPETPPDAGGRAPLTLRGETLWCPTGLPGTEGLKMLRDGLPLGRWRKGRFEPSHTLAQALRADEIGARLELGADGPALARYLAGEELDARELADETARAAADGWAVATVHGAPLGWVRRSGSRLRNLYPRGLRRG